MTIEVNIKDKASYLDVPIIEKMDLDKEEDKTRFKNLYGEIFLNYIRGLKSGGTVEVLITWRD